MGVPPREHGDTDVIERYRSVVVGPAQEWAPRADGTPVDAEG